MGNKRIEAPEKIDRNTNRLPHGRNYAEKGAALDVRVQRNFKIAARVQRTRPVPYKEKLKAILQNRSDLSAILLAGTLPKETLRYHGISQCKTVPRKDFSRTIRKI